MNTKIIFIIILFLGCSAKNSKIKNSTVIRHQLETFIYKSDISDSLYLDIYMILLNNKFVYTKNNNFFNSNINISININNSETETQLIHNSWSESLQEYFYNDTRDIKNKSIIYKRVLLPKGEYKIFLNIEDDDSKNNWIIRKDISIIEISGISKIIAKENNNNEYRLLIGNTIIDQDSIFCFFQINIPENIDSSLFSIKVDNKKISNYKITKLLNNFYSLILPVNEINNNNPILEISILDYVKSISFKYKHNTLESIFTNPDKILEIMYFYSFIDDYKNIESQTDDYKYNIINKYWLEIDPDLSTEKNELMLEFNSRVQFSIKNFSDLGPGWRSDRGRILINYGHPSHKEFSKQNENGFIYLIWYYPSGKKIIFIDQDGFGDYKIYREMY